MGEYAEVRHVQFSPQFGCDDICKQQEAKGFGLLRVVPIHAYCSIAVFARVAPEFSMEYSDGE